MFLKFLQYLSISFGVIVFIICAVMIYSPSAFLKLNQFLNKSYSTRKMLKPFEVTRSFDIFSVLQVRTVFILILVCSVITLFFIFNRFDVNTLSDVFANKNPHEKHVYQTIFSALHLSLIFFLLLVVIISVLSLLSPQSFEAMNKKLSVWISTRKSYKALDVPRDVDVSLMKLRIPIGIIGLVVSLILVITSWKTLQ
ncbi:MAG: hypothetical protein JW928_06510 [Candidatus Aureabacteria bacterium]|nr:hypothetical protein [Candidatus Auribacterota bacterium]